MTQRLETIGLAEMKHILESIKFDVSNWERLNWFIEFSKKNLDQATQGERLSIREQLASIARNLTIQSLPVPHEQYSLLPDWGKVEAIQARICQHLDEWLADGSIVMEPVHLSISIYHVKSSAIHPQFRGKPLNDPSVRSRIPGQEERVHFARYELRDLKEKVLYTLGELLRDHASSISRCQHCQTIFLKMRKHARYCTRKCHSVAGMRKKRAVEKELKMARKKTREKTRNQNRRRERL